MEKQTLNQQYQALINAFIIHFEKKHNLTYITSKSTIAHQFKDSDNNIIYTSLEDIVRDNKPDVKKDYFMEWYKLDQFKTYKDFLNEKKAKRTIENEF